MISILLTAVGLAMDAFAVSVSNGMALKKYRLRYSFIFGFYFGLFQFSMTFFGYLAGQSFKSYVDRFGYWIAFILLMVIGIKMFLDSGGGAEEKSADTKTVMAIRNMSLLALATSIDAMAVGVSYALTRADILTPALIIGTVAFLFSAAGVALGKKLGRYAENAAGRIGGGILIFIGLQTFVKNILFA